MSKFDGLLERKGKAQQKHIGRPLGKASDPAYRQVTVYLRRDTHTAARQRLFAEEREFSELVEELVAKWNATPPHKEKRERHG